MLKLRPTYFSRIDFGYPKLQFLGTRHITCTVHTQLYIYLPSSILLRIDFGTQIMVKSINVIVMVPGIIWNQS